MSFSGAPNVFRVKLNGNDSRQGKDWSDDPTTGALATISGALGKIASGTGAIILIAPGRYLNAAARATVAKSDVRFQGAGRGAVLEVNDMDSPLLTLTANNLEFADLTLVNSFASGEGVAMVNGAGGPFANLRILRCIMKGRKTFQPFNYKNILIQESAIEGTLTSFKFGNQQEADAPQFSCIASTSDFRAVTPVPASAEAVVVDGGKLTAVNCNFTTISPNTGSNNLRYVGLKADHGGQIVLLNCEIAVDKSSTALDTSTRVGVDVVSATTRMLLTGCSIIARQTDSGTGAKTPFSIEPNAPNPGIDERAMANACLLTPPWSPS